MKRMHVGLDVADLKASRDFYSRLFGCPPTLERPDYAKWMLEDPYVNFSIIERPEKAGEIHLGVQLEDAAALADARDHLSAQSFETAEQNNLTCGYQVQSKSWVYDPQGIAWEHFHTFGLADSYGENTDDGLERTRLRAKSIAGGG